MLKVSDVYDFYGLSVIDEKTLDEEGKNLFSFYLTEIQQAYVKTLKKRIIEEAGYMSLDVAGASIEAMLRDMKGKMDEQIKAQAASMSRTGLGFNMMELIKSEHKEHNKPKDKMAGAADAFRSKQGKSMSAFGGEPWAVISEAFLAIEKAKSNKAIIESIDHLNDLQHNCCHVIFDLTGTRGGGGSNHNAVQAVLNEKFKAKTPREFAGKMSSDVRNFLQYRII
jgi:hypothetical protein